MRLAKLTNHYPDSSRKEKEKNQINKIRNEKGEVTTDNAETQRIIREYYEQQHKMDNIEEMDRFLENVNFPRLNQEEIDIMKKPVTNAEIETVTKSPPKT